MFKPVSHRLGLFGLAGAMVFSAWRCGADPKRGDRSAATDVGQAPSTQGSNLPPAWDGRADYTDSSFQVIDE